MNNQCTIINSEKLYQSLQLKTVSLSSENIANKKQFVRQTYHRISSSQSTKANQKNFEVAMKLNINYNDIKQMDLERTAKKSFVRSFGFVRINSSVSPKKLQKSYINLTKANEKLNRKINTLVQTKFGNYKNFPKREPKLKNTSPYKFYMFGSKSNEKYQQNQDKDKNQGLIKIKDYCTFIPNSSAPIHSKRHVKQIKYKNEKNIFQPWNFTDGDGKDDQLIF